MSISFESTGNWENTERFLNRMSRDDIFKALNQAGAQGVQVLSSATPKESGKTASSWTYEIEASIGSYTIHWLNTHISDGVNIAVIIQTGHGTGTGGYISGRDYIKPAIRPIFEKIANDVWKEVTR